jgi:hypothetical protein
MYIKISEKLMVPTGSQLHLDWVKANKPKAKPKDKPAVDKKISKE